MTRASRPLDLGFRDELVRDPENAAFYLEQILESGDLELFQEVLRNVAKAQGGDVSGENLYDAFSTTGKSQFETVTKILGALGLRLTVKPVHQ